MVIKEHLKCKFILFYFINSKGRGLPYQFSLIVHKKSSIQIANPWSLTRRDTEACALLNAIDFAVESEIGEWCFKTLADGSTGTQLPIDTDWRAHKEIYEMWKKLKCNPKFIWYIRRSHNAWDGGHTCKEGVDKQKKHTLVFIYPIFPV